jgi:hypothetical protein
MKYRALHIFAFLAVGCSVLVGCSDKNVQGSPTTSGSQAASDNSDAPKTVPHSGAPHVADPLPTRALDSDPCQTALSSGDLTRFLGTVDPPRPNEDQLGKNCRWFNGSGSGAAFTVAYQTKSDQGISLAYLNVKPTAARWDELAGVQGHPAIGYQIGGTPASDNYTCQVVVGASDQLAYSVGMTLGENARGRRDACEVGRDVADAVMTNLKARAK